MKHEELDKTWKVDLDNKLILSNEIKKADTYLPSND